MLHFSYPTADANVENVPLVDPKKIILPPLHIKLGLIYDQKGG